MKHTQSKSEKWITFLGVVFVASCILLIPASSMYGDYGVSLITVMMTYPALILLLGIPAFNDLKMLLGLIKKKQIKEAGMVGVVFFSCRGLVFTVAVVVFIYMEIQILQGLKFF